MLGFVHTEPWENPGFLTRVRCAVDKRYGVEVSERALFGRSAVYVQERRGCRRALGRVLAERGVDKVAFAGERPRSPVATAPSKRGGQGPMPPSQAREVARSVGGRPPLQEMSSEYLHTYLAGDVGVHVAERSGATAVCFLRSVGQLEERALLQLASSFRYLMLSIRRDGDLVCRTLRRRYGLPVVEAPTPNQVRGADFALVLHPPGQDVTLSKRCLAYAPNTALRRSMSGGVPITGLHLRVPSDVAGEVPAGFRAEPVLSEAAFRGWFDPGRIKINGVSIDKTV